MVMHKTNGFSLIELMITVIVLTILSSITYAIYQNYSRERRLQAALSAMMENAQALEQHYSQRGNFKKNSTTWVDLLHTQTSHFCIKMQGNPRGTNNNHQYAMKAVSLDKNIEPRVLVINQDQTVQICESSSSICDDARFFSNAARADKNCTNYR